MMPASDFRSPARPGAASNRIARRRALPAAIALLAVALFVLLSSSGASATNRTASLSEPMTATDCGTQPIKIAFVSALANTYGQAIEKGFREYLAPCKNVKVVDFDTGFDSQKEFSTIQDITTQKTFQGITFLPLDAVGVIPAVKKATAAGIQVVNFNNPVGNNFKTSAVNVPGMAGTVIESQYLRGTWLAQMAAQACKGISDCQIGFIGGGASSAEVAIKSGFLDEMKKHPNMHMVAYSLGGGYLPGPSQKVAQDMLQAHHSMNVITGSGDQMMRGAALAINSAGLQKQVKIIGLGASEIAVAAVKAGQWYGTVITQPLDQGRLTGWVLLRHILNPKLPPQGINPFDYTHRSPLLTQAALSKSHFVPQWSG
jgi:ribose transport system substrate-binding protein